jgi:hypothetical protein
MIRKGPGRFTYEALEEVALCCQSALADNPMPHCAFNGGRDVWVDVGNKSLGIRALQVQWLAPLVLGSSLLSLSSFPHSSSLPRLSHSLPTLSLSLSLSLSRTHYIPVGGSSRSCLRFTIFWERALPPMLWPHGVPVLRSTRIVLASLSLVIAASAVAEPLQPTVTVAVAVVKCHRHRHCAAVVVSRQAYIGVKPAECLHVGDRFTATGAWDWVP